MQIFNFGYVWFEMLLDTTDLRRRGGRTGLQMEIWASSVR